MQRNTLTNTQVLHESQLNSGEKEGIKVAVVEQKLLNENDASCTNTCKISYVNSCKENFMARSCTVKTG